MFMTGLCVCAHVSSPAVSSLSPRFSYVVCLSVSRTQEELRVREEDQQTIRVEVELKRPDSEPTFSVPQLSPQPR